MKGVEPNRLDHDLNDISNEIVYRKSIKKNHKLVLIYLPTESNKIIMNTKLTTVEHEKLTSLPMNKMTLLNH